MGSEVAVIDVAPSAVARMENAPEIVLAEAQKAAAALKKVIQGKPKPVMINGETYLEFEDWQTVGRFYGYTAGLDRPAEFVEIGGARGFKATAVALDSKGVVRSRAEAYCMDDEDRWGKAPTYQLASMAQTRANAKALRNVLSWVTVLAGYKATPAEEMDGVRVALRSPATGVPACPKCGTAKKTIASKYAAKDGSHPWVCLECKSKWGNADAPKPADNADAPWSPEDDEPGARG
jgi:hypothetical protein